MYNLLELHINPFGEVCHEAADAAHNGSSFPVGFLVHFRGAIELGTASGCWKAALKVGDFIFRERVFVVSNESGKVTLGTEFQASSICFCNTLVRLTIIEMILEAALLVG